MTHHRRQTHKRDRLAARDGERCAICGAQRVPLTIDHIVPRSLGGSSRLENLQLACEPCNRTKAATVDHQHAGKMRSPSRDEWVLQIARAGRTLTRRGTKDDAS